MQWIRKLSYIIFHYFSHIDYLINIAHYYDIDSFRFISLITTNIITLLQYTIYIIGKSMITTIHYYASIGNTYFCSYIYYNAVCSK